jgi:hypothetical protein
MDDLKPVEMLNLLLGQLNPYAVHLAVLIKVRPFELVLLVDIDRGGVHEIRLR